MWFSVEKGWDTVMKKIMLIVMAIYLSGCTSHKVIYQEEIMETKPSQLPKVAAFEDDYTRQYMYSTEEVEEGYYLFESLTKNYTMKFPESGYVLQNLKNKDETWEHI